MRGKLPKVSLVILTFNGGKYLKACLSSIKKQKYPKNLMEIIAVDNGSSDKSVQIAKAFGAKVFIKDKTDLYENWAFAMHKVTGDLTYLVDQDIEFRGQDFLKKMVRPLVESPNLAGSFTRAYPNSRMTWITRFISYHPSQCDPLYEFLTPSIEESIVELRKGYSICDFELGKIPAESRMMFRVKFLKKTPIWAMSRLFDHDVFIKTIKAGHSLFAYVSSAGIYHYHADSLVNLLSKRIRNLRIHFFPYHETLEYRWIDSSRENKNMRMILWVLYANLLIPATLRGIWRFIKFRDWVLLAEPLVTLAVTDVVLWSFVTSPVGRRIISNYFKSLMGFRT